MAAAPDLGSGVERRGGSSPFTRTKSPLKMDFFYAHMAKLVNVAVSEAIGFLEFIGIIFNLVR